MAVYLPHRWQPSSVNGFWAHCNCGYSASSISSRLLARRMDRHVREATEVDLMAARVAQIRDGRDA